MQRYHVFSFVSGALLALSITFPAEATPRDSTQESAQAGAPVLVRVVRVSGVGPDGREVLLFDGGAGRLVPIMDFSSLGGFEKRLARGAYHSLRAELANELYVAVPAGSTLKTAFYPDSDTVELPLAGAVVTNGERIQALGLVPEFIVSGRQNHSR